MVSDSKKKKENELVIIITLRIDQNNVYHLLNHKVQIAAGALFQLGPFHDRNMYPTVLPILSLLVNYGKHSPPLSIHTCSHHLKISQSPDFLL
jgi:hypothetical protein